MNLQKLPNYVKRVGFVINIEEGLFLLQVGVFASQPVFARRAENIEVDGIFKSFKAVGHVRRDDQNIACLDVVFLAPAKDFYGPLHDVGDLFAHMVVFRNNGPFLELKIDQHPILPRDIAAGNVLVHLFKGHGIKMIEFWGVHKFSAFIPLVIEKSFLATPHPGLASDSHRI